MSRLKKASLGLLGIVAVLVTVFLLINLGDDEISDGVRARLSSRVPVPAAVLEGYKYELGLFAPLDQNPSTAGAALYERMLKRRREAVVKLPSSLEISGKFKWCVKSSYYCSRADLKLHEKDLRDLVVQNSALLERYDELMKFPGATGNTKPSIFVHSNAFGLMKLANLKRVDWSRRLTEQDDQRVLTEWKASNDFYRAKLRYPDSMLGAIVSLAILNNNRAFLAAAMQEKPGLRPSSEILKSAELDVPFQTIQNSIALAELEMTDEIVHLEMREGFFGLAGDPPPKIDFTKISAVGFRPNQTLNDVETRLAKTMQDECVVTARACPERHSLTLSDMIKNPVGNIVIEIMSGYFPARLKDAYRTYEKLRRPFSGSELSS